MAKKSTKHFTTPYSIHFVNVLHQNKALHNFHRKGQHSIAECIKGLTWDLTMSQNLASVFFKLILNILWKFHVVQNWIHKLRTLAVGDFSNYNHFIKFNFLLMNNISISTEMYIEPWVNAVKLDVQCDHHLLLPLFLITSAIGLLNYCQIFCQSIPCIWYCCWKPFDVFILHYVLVKHHAQNCIIR